MRVVAAVVGGLEGEAVAVAAAAPQPRGALGVLVAVALPWGRSRGAEARLQDRREVSGEEDLPSLQCQPMALRAVQQPSPPEHTGSSAGAGEGHTLDRGQGRAQRAARAYSKLKFLIPSFELVLELELQGVSQHWTPGKFG